MTTLDTARLHLREPRDADVPALIAFHARNEDRFARWEPPRATEPGAQARWVRWRLEESAVRSGFSLLAFDRMRPAELVGTINVFGIERHTRHAAMIGYNLDGAYEGRGYAREAVGATVAHLFARLNLKKVNANYQPSNERSGALLRRLGFVVEGYARDHLYLRGVWRDHVLTSLTNPDWTPPPLG